MKQLFLIIFIYIILSSVSFNTYSQSKDEIPIKSYKVTNIALDSILKAATKQVLDSKLLKKTLYGEIELIYDEDRLIIMASFYNEDTYYKFDNSDILGYIEYKGIPIFLYSKKNNCYNLDSNTPFHSNNICKMFKIDQKTAQTEPAVGNILMRYKDDVIELIAYVIVHDNH
jgi:hypothetical protein